ALDEGADGVEMDIAFLVVQDCAPLDRLLSDLTRYVPDAVSVGFRGGDRQLDGVEGRAGVTVGDVDEVIERIVMQLHLQVAVTAALRLKRLVDDAAQVLLVQRFQLEDAAAADERLVDLEVRVLG